MTKSLGRIEKNCKTKNETLLNIAVIFDLLSLKIPSLVYTEKCWCYTQTKKKGLSKKGRGGGGSYWATE